MRACARSAQCASCGAIHAVRAVRMSAGWETTEGDWDALLKAVVKVHGEMQHKG